MSALSPNYVNRISHIGEEEYQNTFNEDFTNIPWLKEAIAEEKSITEVEFLFGALKREENSNAVFYIKENVVREPRQEELKLAIEGQSRFVTRSYSSVKALGDLVYADMIKYIDRTSPVCGEGWDVR